MQNSNNTKNSKIIYNNEERKFSFEFKQKIGKIQETILSICNLYIYAIEYTQIVFEDESVYILGSEFMSFKDKFEDFIENINKKEINIKYFEVFDRKRDEKGNVIKENKIIENYQKFIQENENEEYLNRLNMNLNDNQLNNQFSESFNNIFNQNFFNSFLSAPIRELNPNQINSFQNLNSIPFNQLFGQRNINLRNIVNLNTIIPNQNTQDEQSTEEENSNENEEDENSNEEKEENSNEEEELAQRLEEEDDIQTESYVLEFTIPRHLYENLNNLSSIPVESSEVNNESEDNNESENNNESEDNIRSNESVHLNQNLNNNNLNNLLNIVNEFANLQNNNNPILNFVSSYRTNRGTNNNENTNHSLEEFIGTIENNIINEINNPFFNVNVEEEINNNEDTQNEVENEVENVDEVEDEDELLEEETKEDETPQIRSSVRRTYVGNIPISTRATQIFTTSLNQPNLNINTTTSNRFSTFSRNYRPLNNSSFLFNNLNTVDGLMNTLFQVNLNNINYEDVKIIMTDEEFENMPRINYNENCLNQDCTICMESFNNDELVLKTPCEHCFHIECVKNWFTKESVKCPFCRKEVCKGKPNFN
jgi:hypothetical protein